MQARVAFLEQGTQVVTQEAAQAVMVHQLLLQQWVETVAPVHLAVAAAEVAHHLQTDIRRDLLTVTERAAAAVADTMQVITQPILVAMVALVRQEF